MKKNTIYIVMIAICLLFAFYPKTGRTENLSTTNSISTPRDTTHTLEWLGRLDKIHTMDKSNLSSKEKKELRQEVKQIRKNLKSTGNGVYLSGGALIIIIILLIILL